MKRLLNKNLNLIVCMNLILLIIFGFYKNGIFLYQKGLISLFEMFKPLLLILICISGASLGSFINEWRRQKKLNLDYLERLKSIIIESVILSCTLPLSTSPLILFIIVLCFYTVFGTIKANKIALLFLVVTIINRLIGINNFENVYELSTELNYNALDLFLGMGVGGIASTSIILTIISLLMLSFNRLYKKNIAFSSIVTFVMFTLIIAIFKNTYAGLLTTIFTHNILFAFVFALPDMQSSCYTTKGQILSGIIIGILTTIISYFLPYEGVFIAILFVSLIKNILDRIFVVL